jgi:hypothetical protein
MPRMAFLLRCTMDEAGAVRTEALSANRPLGAYVVNVVLRALAIEDRLLSHNECEFAMHRLHRQSAAAGQAERTALLLRCEPFEWEQIRNAAKRRGMSVNAFVLYTLKRVRAAHHGPTIAAG